MIDLKRSEGFTLVEVLVGISLSFFVISIIIAFFLLVMRITSASTKQLAEKKDIILFIEKLNGYLNKSDHFDVEFERSNLLISSGEGKIMADSKGISINNTFSLDSTVTYNFELTDKKFRKIILESGKEISTAAMSDHKMLLSSAMIESIKLTIYKNQKEYELLYRNPAVSSKRFINLTE